MQSDLTVTGLALRLSHRHANSYSGYAVEEPSVLPNMNFSTARPLLSRPHSGTRDPDLLRIASLPSIPTMSSSNPISTDDPVRAAFEGMSLENRTATSTPSSRHKRSTWFQSVAPQCWLVLLADMYADTSNSKSGLPTPNYVPPRDRFINRSPFGMLPPQIFVEAKLDDDVFSKDADEEREATHSEPTSCVKGYGPDNANPTPRGDRLQGPITALNAQGLFPPKNTVFVAK